MGQQGAWLERKQVKHENRAVGGRLQANFQEDPRKPVWLFDFLADGPPGAAASPKKKRADKQEIGRNCKRPKRMCLNIGKLWQQRARPAWGNRAFLGRTGFSNEFCENNKSSPAAPNRRHD